MFLKFVLALVEIGISFILFNSTCRGAKTGQELADILGIENQAALAIFSQLVDRVNPVAIYVLAVGLANLLVFLLAFFQQLALKCFYCKFVEHIHVGFMLIMELLLIVTCVVFTGYVVTTYSKCFQEELVVLIIFIPLVQLLSLIMALAYFMEDETELPPPQPRSRPTPRRRVPSEESVIELQPRNPVVVEQQKVVEDQQSPTSRRLLNREEEVPLVRDRPRTLNINSTPDVAHQRRWLSTDESYRDAVLPEGRSLTINNPPASTEPSYPEGRLLPGNNTSRREVTYPEGRTVNFTPKERGVKYPEGRK